MKNKNIQIQKRRAKSEKTFVNIWKKLIQGLKGQFKGFLYEVTDT